MTQLASSPTRVNRGSGPFVVAWLGATALGTALAAIPAVATTAGRTSDAAMWALFMLATSVLGGLLGFVFGVPRVRSAYTSAASDRYEPNSALEQISDWLTKLLVGAGLVQLGAAPRYLGDLSDYLSSSVSVPGGAAYVGSAVVYGAGAGFATGYVWTRLHFRILLEGAEKDASQAARTEIITNQLASTAGQGESKAELRLAAANVVALSDEARQESVLPILWVDDHPENNRGLVRSLRELGIAVDQVTSTEKALAQIDRVDYAAIITDLGRQESGGYNDMAGRDLLEALAGRSVATPVIVFAGPRGAQERAALMEAGARLVTQRASEVLQEAVSYALGR